MATPKPSPRFNPRGADRRGKPLGGRPAPMLWYGLAFLLVLGLANAYFLMPAGRQIPYSEFKQLLKSGAVTEVTVGEQTIRGTLKEPLPGDPNQSKQFTTTRVEDPKLAEELEAQQVKFAGEMVNHWLPELLGWVLPIIFI